MSQVFLTRRNLEVLLSKLDRKKIGEATGLTINKYRNANNPAQYQQSMSAIAVTAVEDEDYYVTRPAGAMHPADEPPLRHSTGTASNVY